MPKPFSPLVITKFLGENDVIPATEMDDAQCSLAQNLYIVQGGLERRLGTAAVSTSLGSSKAVQGMQYCRLDGNINGSSSGLSPLDPAVSAYLQLYLRSDQVSGSEGSAVTTWPDISGYARDASQAAGGSKPVLRVSTNLSPNGTRLVEFNTTAKEMTGPLPLAPIDNTLGYTWYSVFRINTIGVSNFVGQYVMGSVFANYVEVFARGSAGWGYSSDTNYGFGSNQVGATHFSTSTALTTGWQSLVLVQNPPVGASGESYLYLNGTQIGGPKAWTSSLTTGYGIGGNAGNGGLLGGMGAVIMYSKAHDATTRAAILAYLNDFFVS